MCKDKVDKRIVLFILREIWRGLPKNIEEFLWVMPGGVYVSAGDEQADQEACHLLFNENRLMLIWARSASGIGRSYHLRFSSRGELLVLFDPYGTR